MGKREDRKKKGGTGVRRGSRSGQVITCAKEELPKMAVETSVLAMDQASASCVTLQPSSFARSCSLPAHYNSTTPIHATP